GTLKGDEPPPEPDAKKLAKSVAAYREKAGDEDRADRELLLRAFSAQSSIEWPPLEKVLAGGVQRARRRRPRLPVPRPAAPRSDGPRGCDSPTRRGPRR